MTRDALLDLNQRLKEVSADIREFNKCQQEHIITLVEIKAELAQCVESIESLTHLVLTGNGSESLMVRMARQEEATKRLTGAQRDSTGRARHWAATMISVLAIAISLVGSCG